jgi:hypothetical protein
MSVYKPYVQDVDDWIKFYAKGDTSHNKDSGEGVGGIGGESGNTANPVERKVPNNLKVLDSKMRLGELSSMPGQQAVQQALARKRRCKRKPVRRLKGRKKSKKRKRRTNGKHKSKKKPRRRRKQRHLFD